jgi:predicted negative regulator of RcsB-dependent stress response
MARKIRRKELKEPDEFLTLSHQFLEYAKQHERELTVAVLGLVVVTALALGVRWYRSSQNAKAEAAFGAARRDFAAQKFDIATTGLSRVTSTWPSTSYGRLALIYLGNSYAELAKTKEAEEAFRQALSRGDDDLVRQIALYNLGILAVKAGEKKDAVEHLTAAAAIDGPLRGPAWFVRLSSQQQFTENVGQGMQAINELSPEAREYVEAQIAAQAQIAGK